MVFNVFLSAQFSTINYPTDLALFYKLIFGNIGLFVNDILHKTLNYKPNISLIVCPKRKERGNASDAKPLSFSKKDKIFFDLFPRRYEKKLKFTNHKKKGRIFGKDLHNSPYSLL
jgi:hypothetical protein